MVKVLHIHIYLGKTTFKQPDWVLTEHYEHC